MSKVTETTTEEQRISEKYDALTEIYSTLPKGELELIKPLLKNFAFQVVKMADWQDRMVDTEDYDTLGAYSKLSGTYLSTYKELRRLLPAEVEESELEKLMNE